MYYKCFRNKQNNWIYLHLSGLKQQSYWQNFCCCNCYFIEKVYRGHLKIFSIGKLEENLKIVEKSMTIILFTEEQRGFVVLETWRCPERAWEIPKRLAVDAARWKAISKLVDFLQEIWLKTFLSINLSVFCGKNLFHHFSLFFLFLK